MIRMIAVSAALAATPALAAGDVFFSLRNSDFVVLIAFLLFIGLLVYLKVPSTLMGMLDKRAAGIEADLAEARSLREDAQSLLASYERKQRETKDQAERIVAHARTEAEEASEKAKADLERSVERRLQAAEEQIASAEARAVKEVRDRAVQVAIAAAADVLSKQMDGKRHGELIDQSLATVGAKLH
ncbi:F0F1 ATP synthase subunit B [Rhodobacteraceae bacterium CCMM004]|nr:F0F1 ATP synthase subunit B [Rhodobacteraceae bacterium CCMM004]